MAEFPNTFGSGKYPGNTISYVGRGVGGRPTERKRKKSENRDRDRCKTTGCAQKNWYVNKRNPNNTKNTKIKQL